MSTFPLHVSSRGGGEGGGVGVEGAVTAGGAVSGARFPAGVVSDRPLHDGSAAPRTTIRIGTKRPCGEECRGATITHTPCRDAASSLTMGRKRRTREPGRS